MIYLRIPIYVSPENVRAIYLRVALKENKKQLRPEAAYLSQILNIKNPTLLA